MRTLLLASLLAASCHPARNDPAPAASVGGATKPTTTVIAAVPIPVIAPKQAAPSWLGVRFDRESTRVVQVVAGAPADKAGIKVGDSVSSIDGRRVTAGDEAVRVIRAHAAGNTPITVQRGGKELVLSVPLAPMPEVDDVPKQSLVGRPAPPFAAQLISGDFTPSLHDLAGHVVVLDFWATWCGPCEDTMPVLDQWQATYGPRGLRVIGLSSESEPEIRKFLTEHKLGYAIARDVDEQIGRDYLRASVPMLVVIDKTGVVRHVQIGAGRFAAVEAAITKLL